MSDINVDNSIKLSKEAQLKARLNVQLSLHLYKQYDTNGRKDETYIIQSPAFLNAIKIARQNLALTNIVKIDEAGVVEWFAQQKTGLTNQGIVGAPPQYMKWVKVFYDEARMATEAANLTDEWLPYVAFYIVNQSPPSVEALLPPELILVDEVTEAGDILIRIKKGLRREDYLQAWKVLSPLLGSAQSHKQPYTKAERNHQILADYDSGMTAREVAKKHLREQFDDDYKKATTSVEQIIYRERKRQKGISGHS